MTEERKPKEDNLDTVTRRGFIKVAGLGALGMAYATPVINSLHGSISFLLLRRWRSSPSPSYLWLVRSS